MEGFDHLQTIKVVIKDTAVVITIAREKHLNALNQTVLSELEFVLDTLAVKAPAKPLIITGDGPRAFAAGADISGMIGMTSKEASEFSRFGQKVFLKLESYPAVTIAAVNGYALGGGNELAISCDIRIAEKNAKFGQPEVGLGIIPGFGGIHRLVRIVGESCASDLIFTGRTIDATEALKIGLVHKIVEQGEALKDSLSYSKRLSKNSSFALIQAKKAIVHAQANSLGVEVATEAKLFSQCFDHADQQEGMKAFLEKRSPQFQTE